jgi:urate oxidase
VLPTDTQKNTVYALARKLGDIEPEAFALELAAHYAGRREGITRARIAIEEYPWVPISGGGHSFARSGQYTRTTTVIDDEGQGRSVVSGLCDLIVLNTTGSQFWGFPRDEYTTLEDVYDRMLATVVSAQWRFRDTAADVTDWAAAFTTARSALIDAFAETTSYSLQQTLYAMGSAILAAVPQICEVRLALPNKHHFLVDLTPFGLANSNEVYYAADRLPDRLADGPAEVRRRRIREMVRHRPPRSTSATPSSRPPPSSPCASWCW